jgi:CHAD domain-containing protein
MALDRDQLRKSVGKLRQFLKKQKSMTPEKIHQFRTQARRFEASVKALGSSTRDNEERLLRDLARLRKQAGRIRDMDVFTGWALTIRPEGEQDCAVQLLEHLGAERYKRAKKMLQQAGKYH